MRVFVRVFVRIFFAGERGSWMPRYAALRAAPRCGPNVCGLIACGGAGGEEAQTAPGRLDQVSAMRSARTATATAPASGEPMLRSPL